MAMPAFITMWLNMALRGLILAFAWWSSCGQGGKLAIPMRKLMPRGDACLSSPQKASVSSSTSAGVCRARELPPMSSSIEVTDAIVRRPAGERVQSRSVVIVPPLRLTVVTPEIGVVSLSIEEPRKRPTASGAS